MERRSIGNTRRWADGYLQHRGRSLLATAARLRILSPYLSEALRVNP
jgi:hypothetical protein